MKKVYVTGLGCLSSVGLNVETSFQALVDGKCGIQKFPEWANYKGLNTHLGAPVGEVDVSKIPRSARRTMSRMSEMATIATLEATAQAKLRFENHAYTPRILLCLGSTTGSPESLDNYFRKLHERGGPEGQLGTTFFKCMNHSVSSNVASALEFYGPALGPSSACATSSQAVALGWELLQTGLYDIVIAGGADELHHNSASVFDIVMAASRNYNDQPEIASRPFDKKRDGLVVSEGASVLVLETEESANRREVQKLAQLKGAFYSCDGTHMTQTQSDSMAETMKMAMERAGIKASDINYVNAHATSTIMGDQEEAKAIAKAIGSATPVSSLKGNAGHSLAACGGFEAIMSIKMMQNGLILPTHNLTEVDPACAGIRHVQKIEKRELRNILSNNFAFGGINTSLILSSVE